MSRATYADPAALVAACVIAACASWALENASPSMLLEAAAEEASQAAQAVTTISFDVVNGGTPWASAADVLAFNSKGFDAAAHIFINGGAVTGFAGEPSGGGGHVPDGGATAVLLGLGLAGLGGLYAKFGRK